MQRLTEDMIRITTYSIGATGRAVRDRKLVVFVGNHMLKDARGRQRRFAFPRTARAAARAFIAEHNQTALSDDEIDLRSGLPLDAHDPRWTRQGRVLSYDGVEALEVGRFASTHNTFKLSPVTCDAIADYVCSMLNTIDVDALTRLWMDKP